MSSLLVPVTESLGGVEAIESTESLPKADVKLEDMAVGLYPLGARYLIAEAIHNAVICTKVCENRWDGWRATVVIAHADF